jgi:hypothetical protein
MDIQKPKEMISRISTVSMKNHRNSKNLFTIFKYVHAKHKIKIGNYLWDLRFSQQCCGDSGRVGCDAVLGE